LAFGSWLLALGFWLLAFGSWLLALGFWLLAFGSWLLAFGFWLEPLSWQHFRRATAGPHQRRATAEPHQAQSNPYRSFDQLKRFGARFLKIKRRGRLARRADASGAKQTCR